MLTSKTQNCWHEDPELLTQDLELLTSKTQNWWQDPKATTMWDPSVVAKYLILEGRYIFGKHKHWTFIERKAP